MMTGFLAVTSPDKVARPPKSDVVSIPFSVDSKKGEPSNG
jgi:hypothetical protein